MQGYAKKQGRESVTAPLPGRSSLPEQEHALSIRREVRSKPLVGGCVPAIPSELGSSVPALLESKCLALWVVLDPSQHFSPFSYEPIYLITGVYR